MHMQVIHGLPVLTGALAHMAAKIAAEHECGDHTLFVGALFHMTAEPSRQPLLYHESRFGTLVHTKQDRLIPAPDFW